MVFSGYFFLSLLISAWRCFLTRTFFIIVMTSAVVSRSLFLDITIDNEAEVSNYDVKISQPKDTFDGRAENRGIGRIRIGFAKYGILMHFKLDLLSLTFEGCSLQ